MNEAERQRARDVAWSLFQACLPEPPRPARGGDETPRRALPVTPAVRCWTPFRDWERGEAAIESLRQTLAAYRALLPDGAKFEPAALISDGSAVVAEATATGHGAASVTLVLTLRGGLVDEIRCYADPRELNPSSGRGARSGTGDRIVDHTG